MTSRLGTGISKSFFYSADHGTECLWEPCLISNRRDLEPKKTRARSAGARSASITLTSSTLPPFQSMSADYYKRHSDTLVLLYNGGSWNGCSTKQWLHICTMFNILYIALHIRRGRQRPIGTPVVSGSYQNYRNCAVWNQLPDIGRGNSLFFFLRKPTTV